MAEDSNCHNGNMSGAFDEISEHGCDMINDEDAVRHGEGDEIVISPKAILMRYKHDLFRVRTDKEMAEKLEIPPSTLSSWWKRGDVDLMVIARHMGPFSMDYLLTGKGPKLREVRESPIIMNHQCGINTFGAGPHSHSDLLMTINSLVADKEYMKKQIEYLQRTNESLLKKVL